MHINMKYYVVSIGAIFISLGIGMLVGFNLNYDQELTDQQANVISDLDNKFEELRKVNKGLEDSLEMSNKEYEKAIDFISDNINNIVRDTLLEENIGIISTNQENDYTTEIKDIINRSGANVAFDIVLMNNIFNEAKIKELSETIDTKLENTEDVINYVITALNEDKAKDILTPLEELDIVKIKELSDEYNNCSSVVIAGGNNGKLGQEQFEKIDMPLISTLKKDNIHVVGVQRSDAKFSYSDLYFNDKVASVGNIDQEIGKIALVMLLEDSNILGKYGTIEGTEGVLPNNN